MSGPNAVAGRRIAAAAGALLAIAVLAGAGWLLLRPRPLVVCADPNNLPFSNQAGAGFENRLAELIARDLGRKVEWVWWAQRRGYVRNTLKEARCDLWPGVASTIDMMTTTRPYYRSTYVFVTRSADGLAGLTLDDPRLRRLRIGVQMVGDDGMNTPPAHALARRGIVGNVRGYLVYGDYREANPAADIVRAVAQRKVDVALVWGPLAGYFARTSPVPLRLDPVTPWLDAMRWPMAFDISVGLRKGNEPLRRRIDQILSRRRPQVRALLDAYGVPPAPGSPE